jgi:hypothetical protein
MDGAGNSHVRDEKCIQNFWSVNMNVRAHLEDLGVDGE